MAILKLADFWAPSSRSYFVLALGASRNVSNASDLILFYICGLTVIASKENNGKFCVVRQMSF